MNKKNIFLSDLPHKKKQYLSPQIKSVNSCPQLVRKEHTREERKYLEKENI